MYFSSVHSNGIRCVDRDAHVRKHRPGPHRKSQDSYFDVILTEIPGPMDMNNYVEVYRKTRKIQYFWWDNIHFNCKWILEQWWVGVKASKCTEVSYKQ